MSSVSTFPAFIDSLRQLLADRPGLSDVAVFTGPMDYISAGQKCIAFSVDQTTASYEYVQGPLHIVDEEYETEGRIWTAVTGADEAAIKAARDLAFGILEEVHDQLATSSATTAGSESALTAWDARLVGWSIEQPILDNGRECRLSFRVAAKARFTPS